MYFFCMEYLFLLQFAFEHNETIVRKLNKPKVWINKNQLILSYDSINQLNLMPNKNLKINSKIDSLWSVIDKTSTSLGKRLLKEFLLIYST